MTESLGGRYGKNTKMELWFGLFNWTMVGRMGKPRNQGIPLSRNLNMSSCLIFLGEHW